MQFMRLTAEIHYSNQRINMHIYIYQISSVGPPARHRNNAILDYLPTQFMLLSDDLDSL